MEYGAGGTLEDGVLSFEHGWNERSTTRLLERRMDSESRLATYQPAIRKGPCHHKVGSSCLPP